MDAAKRIVQTITGKGWSTWRIHTPGTPKEARIVVDWARSAKPEAGDGRGFCWVWVQAAVRIGKAGLAPLPEHFSVDPDRSGGSFGSSVEPKSRGDADPSGETPLEVLSRGSAWDPRESARTSAP